MGPRAGAPAEHHGVMLGAAEGVSSASATSPSRRSRMSGAWAASSASPRALGSRHRPASVVAFYASARGLQDGDAVPVIADHRQGPRTSPASPAASIVFGDPMPGDALGIIPQAIAFVMG